MSDVDSERLDKMREVLQWASDHVDEVVKEKDGWGCFTRGFSYSSHTLYECLLNAWVDAHPKP